MASESDLKQKLEDYEAEIEEKKKTIQVLQVSKNHWIAEHKRMVLFLKELAEATDFDQKSEFKRIYNLSDMQYNGVDGTTVQKLLQHVKTTVKAATNAHEDPFSDTGSSIVEVTVSSGSAKRKALASNLFHRRSIQDTINLCDESSVIQDPSAQPASVEMDDEFEDDWTTPSDIQPFGNPKSTPATPGLCDEPSSVQLSSTQNVASMIDEESEDDLTTPPDIQPFGNPKSTPATPGLCDEPSSVQLSSTQNVASMRDEVSEDEDATPPTVPRKKKTCKSGIKYHWNMKIVTEMVAKIGSHDCSAIYSDTGDGDSDTRDQDRPRQVEDSDPSVASTSIGTMAIGDNTGPGLDHPRSVEEGCKGNNKCYICGLFFDHMAVLNFHIKKKHPNVSMTQRLESNKPCKRKCAASSTLGQPNQSKKSKPETDLKKELMGMHEEIVNGKLGVSQSLTKWHTLRDPDTWRLLNYYLTDKKMADFESLIRTVMARHARKEVRNGYSKCKNRLCQESFKILKKEADHSPDKLDAARMIIMGCSRTGSTWWGETFKIIRKESDLAGIRPQPTIVVHGTPFEDGVADVYCEGEILSEGIGFFEAILQAYYLYWVFHIDYTQGDKMLFKLFDSAIIKMD